MNIRYGTKEDAALIAEIGAKTFHETYIEQSDPAVLSEYIKKSYSAELQLEELSDPNTIYLIAEVDGGPAGITKLKLDSFNEILSDPKLLEFPDFIC